MFRNFLLALLLCCGTMTTLSGKENFYQSNLFDSVGPDDKVAILMVHFGTSYSDTRAKTIDAMNALALEAFPDIEQRQAWTSRILIKILGRRGETIKTPYEALEELHAEGYTHVIVQSSNIIEGVEMESLRRDVAALIDNFKDIRIGNPLLYTPEDYEIVVDLLRSKQPQGSSLVVVGHGTYTPATAQYAMVDYVVRDKGYEGIHMGTIEGYPTFETLLRRLEADGTKSVVLMPFMFVAGQHAKSDIAEDWNDALTEAGYDVELLLEGLGEQAAIQQLFIEHMRFATEYQMYDIMEKKAGYSAQ